MSVATWATLATAIASILTVVVGGFALFFEGRRARLSIGIDNLWRLIEEWDSPEMRWRRSQLGQQLLAEPARRDVVSDDAIDVLNTFELLGYLVLRSKTLRLEDAWVNFSPWAVSWWGIYRSAIERMREEDSTVFEDYTELVQKFTAYEAHKRRIPESSVIPSGDAVEGFLRSETALRWRLAMPEPALAEATFRRWAGARLARWWRDQGPPAGG